jgi:alpha-L-rhamnosidase
LIRTIFFVGIFCCLFFVADAQVKVSLPVFDGSDGFQKAKWIEPGFAEDTAQRSPAIFRTAFDSYRPIRSAYLTVTAHGIYEGELNGSRIGKAYFAPGFTSYHRRLQYQVYNVTALVKQHNQLSFTVAEGWWRGVYGGDMKNNHYGANCALLAQLEITYSDGTKKIIASDKSWQSAIGKITYADFYNGEVVDATRDSSEWSGVNVVQADQSELFPSVAPMVTAHEQLKPVKIFKAPNGDHLIDFGQNMAGIISLKVGGKPGDTVRVFHAETLDEKGNFYAGNLRNAAAEDVFILTGKGMETFEPHFTYHGFRYIKVLGYPGELKAKNFTAIALYSDMPKTGSFSCSNPMLKQLQSNITWSQRSNFMDIPTDCPQRSERYGWTADAQVFCPTAAFNYNVDSFYTKWLADLAADQGPDGAVPRIVPNFFNTPPTDGVAGWSDAATIVPWDLYEIYGDTAVLRAQYNSMKAWVDYVTAHAKDDLWTANGYGDWYAPNDPTSLPYIDQCYWYHSCWIIQQTAMVLGHQDDYQKYTDLLAKIKTAFDNTYLDHIPNTETANVLALQFDLLPDKQVQAAVERLVSLIHQNNDHLSTGFLGTPFLLGVLSRYGHSELAYRILLQTSAPSWLYPITKGATTIWEKWDAIKPDGTVQACSLNHYAYGAVGDWMYRNIAGINAAAPGYQKIMIRPEPGGGITWAKGSYMCAYGKIVSAWKIVKGQFLLEVIIPKGTTAAIYLPKGHVKNVGPGHYHYQIQL